MRQKLEKLMQEYGYVAVVVFFTLFFLTWGGFILAISAGFRPQSGGGKWGVVGAAYLATEVSKPLRIAATFALTPLVARAWRKLRPPPAAPPPVS